jgi:hypothetical protein
MGTSEGKQEMGFRREIEAHGQEAQDVLKEEKQEMNFIREEEIG